MAQTKSRGRTNGRRRLGRGLGSLMSIEVPVDLGPGPHDDDSATSTTPPEIDRAERSPSSDAGGRAGATTVGSASPRAAGDDGGEADGEAAGRAPSPAAAGDRGPKSADTARPITRTKGGEAEPLAVAVGEDEAVGVRADVAEGRADDRTGTGTRTGTGPGARADAGTGPDAGAGGEAVDGREHGGADAGGVAAGRRTAKIDRTTDGSKVNAGRGTASARGTGDDGSTADAGKATADGGNAADAGNAAGARVAESAADGGGAKEDRGVGVARSRAGARSGGKTPSAAEGPKIGLAGGKVGAGNTSDALSTSAAERAADAGTEDDGADDSIATNGSSRVHNAASRATSSAATADDGHELGDGEVGASAGLLVRRVPVESIRPNSSQPRQTFSDESIASLAESIRTNGLMQPILVRADGEGRYELIAGERRWRAAKRVPLRSIPAIVHDIDDRAAAEWALVENLQREDLNPIDRAEAFATLAGRFGLTHTELAERVGLDRSSVTNIIRLNDLDAECKSLVREGLLGAGHARALLAVGDAARRAALARRAVEDGWSARETERHARHETEPKRSTPGAAVGSRGAHLEHLERELGRHLGTRVRLTRGRKPGSGRISIEFYSLDQFDGLMRRMGYEEGA